MASPSDAIGRLLRFITEGKVVPIIGPALSIVEVDGQRKTVEQVLAKSLADMLESTLGGDETSKLHLPDNYTLNNVVCSYPDFSNDLYSICADLSNIMVTSHFAVPEPLKKLARISAFRLYVTTSFDGLLDRALRDESSWRGEIETLTYYLNSKTDLADFVAEDDRHTILFELFGRVSSSALDQFTLTEDDLLEFAHNLQSKPPESPHRLLQKTHDAHLLFIGNGFPDWLSRFFLRTIKHQRNRSPRNFTEYIADARVRQDETLMRFINNFSRPTTVVDTEDIIGFVDELYDRWAKEHPEGAAATPSSQPQARDIPASQSDQQKAMIFLSYVREDAKSALNIKHSLEQIGWTVWMDTDESIGLERGDEWRQRIQKEIKRCDIFMPILSRNTDSTLPGEKAGFRHEWKWALDESGGNFGMDWQFITPVRIDDISVSAARVPEEFRKLNWGPAAPNGVLNESSLVSFKNRLRELRSRRTKLDS